MRRSAFGPRSYAPGETLSAAEAGRAVEDLLSRVQQQGRLTGEDAVGFVSEVYSIIRRVHPEEWRGSQELLDATRQAERVVDDSEFPDEVGRREKRRAKEDLKELQDAIGDRGGAAAGRVEEVMKAMEERVRSMREVLGLPSVMDEVQRQILEGEGSSFVGAVDEVVACARQGRVLGEHLGRLETAIDSGDFQQVVNLTAHVVFHMGRLGACGEDFDHDRVAAAAEDLVASMERGDEMGAMSALDRLRTMEE